MIQPENAGYLSRPPLNLSEECAIFSVSVLPQPCPARRLQFVGFRHTV